MPLDYKEEIALQGSYTSRPESPTLEGAAAYAIESAFRELIENRYLYQKLTVDFGIIDPAVKEAVQQAELWAAKPRTDGGFVPQPTPATPQRLKELRAEVAKRPWRLATRHMGDDPKMAEIHRMARIGTQPLGVAQEMINIHFYLPAVRLRCPARCKGVATFVALVSSKDSGFGSAFPRESTAGIEQIFTPVYRCEMCRETIYTLLVRRAGDRLHLCGFAPRREPMSAKRVPEKLIPILNDAEQAVAEGDIYAGFYHLRTMLEHYMKARLGIPLTQQVRGDELVAKHNQSLPLGFSSALPSFSVAWEKLSEWLHTRSGEAKDYQSQRDAVCKHIEVLDALGDGGRALDGTD